MKTIHFFYAGLIIDTLLLIVLISSLASVYSPVEGYEGVPMDHLPESARLKLWLLPALLAAMIATAYLLRKTGKIFSANVLLWIPALPFLAGVLFWAGLAALFIIA